MTRRTWFTACALAFLTAVGCGPSRPATAPVSGRVTQDGQPVASGRIMFYPEVGRPATGTIASDGRYSLTTFASGDGAVLGKHRVTIEVRREVNDSMPKTLQEEFTTGMGRIRPTSRAAEWLVPEKYASPQTSPLTAEIKAGTNQVDFTLKTAQ